MSAPSFAAETLERGTLRLRSDQSWDAVLAGLSGSAEARRSFTEVLVASEIEAAFWETPPLCAGAEDALFEMVLVPSRALAGMATDSGPFGRELERREPVATFANLGGDAQLLVPTAKGDRSVYAHLLRFLREGQAGQVDALWQVLGNAVRARLVGRPGPLWVSTSGLGVAWLHLRLDDQPKYVTHAPYRTYPFQGGS